MDDVLIVYRDRTRQAGIRTIRGQEILRLEKRYFVLAGDVPLPYYKIERIELDGLAVFERPRE